MSAGRIGGRFGALPQRWRTAFGTTRRSTTDVDKAQPAGPAARGGAGDSERIVRWATLFVAIVASIDDLERRSPNLVVAGFVFTTLASWRTFHPLGRMRIGSRRLTVEAAVEVVLCCAVIGRTLGWSSPFVPPLLATMFAIGAATTVVLALRLTTAGVLVLVLAAFQDGRGGVRSGSPVVIAAIVGLAVCTAALTSRGRLRALALDVQEDLTGQLAIANRAMSSVLARNESNDRIPAMRDLADPWLRTVASTLQVDRAAMYHRAGDGRCVRVAAHNDEAPVDVDASGLPEQVRAALDGSLRRPKSVRTAGGSYRLVAAIGGGSENGPGNGVGNGVVEVERLAKFSAAEIAVHEQECRRFGLTLEGARDLGRLRIAGVETERVRIARDLHDRIGQWLVAIRFGLDQVEQALGARRTATVPGEASESASQQLGNQESASHVRWTRSVAEDATDDLRELITELRSGVTSTRSFGEATAAYCERFAERTGVPVEVACEPLRVPLAVEQVAFRVLQESLNNVDRHAEASSVEVRWRLDGTDAVLTVTDDGKGFDPLHAGRTDSYGVLGMHERAAELFGAVNIDSSPGEGAVVTLRVPVTRVESDD